MTQLLGDEQVAQREGLHGLSVLVRIYDKCGGSHQLLARKAGNVSNLDVFSAEHLDAQLSSLRRDGLSSFSEACSRTKAKRASTSGRDDQKLENLLDRLEDLQIAPVIKSPIVIHGPLYELWIFAVTGMSHYRYQLSATDGPLDALQQWVEELAQLGGIHCS